MFTLVPSNFFNPAQERQALAEVAELREGEEVRHLEIPQYNAVLIYSVDEGGVDNYPEIYKVLEKLKDSPEYNRIVCSFKNGELNIAVAQGNTLMLANSFKAKDFISAEYYIFLTVKSLQINPEVSTICWVSNLDDEDEMSLYRYFKAVVRL